MKPQRDVDNKMRTGSGRELLRGSLVLISTVLRSLNSMMVTNFLLVERERWLHSLRSLHSLSSRHNLCKLNRLSKLNSLSGLNSLNSLNSLKSLNGPNRLMTVHSLNIHRD